jgi:hypothetical protein
VCSALNYGSEWILSGNEAPGRAQAAWHNLYFCRRLQLFEWMDYFVSCRVGFTLPNRYLKHTVNVGGVHKEYKYGAGLLFMSSKAQNILERYNTKSLVSKTDMHKYTSEGMEED